MPRPPGTRLLPFNGPGSEVPNWPMVICLDTEWFGAYARLAHNLKQERMDQDELDHVTRKQRKV